MTIEEPRITTVIATFRRPRLLERAVRSALSQTYGRLRVAVYDNASGDDTETVMQALSAGDARVRYHRHDANIGASANYNFGLQRVETEFFSLLADDDWLLPGLYRAAVDALDASPESDFFCSPTLVRDEMTGVDLPRNSSWNSGGYRGGAEDAAHMARDHFISTGVVFRTRILKDVGLLDRFGSDRNLLVCAAWLKPFVVTRENGAVLTIHPGSFSGGAQGVAFSGSDVFSHGTDYVLGSAFELLRRLKEIHADDERLFDAVRAQARADAAYVYFMRDLQSGKGSNARAILAAADELQMTALSRAVFRLFAVMAALPPLGRLAGRAALLARRLWLRFSAKETSLPTT